MASSRTVITSTTTTTWTKRKPKGSVKCTVCNGKGYIKKDAKRK